MRKILSLLLSFVLMGVVLVSGYMLCSKLGEYRAEYDTRIKRTTEMRKGRTVDFEKLKAENSDVKGWIWLPDTNIDYPVVQGEDNDHYLHRNLDGSYLYDGCIFIDAAVEEPFSTDENTVIYGHHMRSGAMFHDLSRYAREDDFMQEHDTIIIETEDGSYDMKVVAYCNEDSDSDLYTTGFSDAQSWEFDSFEDDEDREYSGMTKEDFVKLVKDKAKKLSGESFDANDTYVTLSTCAYSSGETRHQIIGVLRPAETKEVVTTEEVNTFNKWYALQIVVAIVMALSLIALITSVIQTVRGSRSKKGADRESV